MFLFDSQLCDPDDFSLRLLYMWIEKDLLYKCKCSYKHTAWFLVKELRVRLDLNFVLGPIQYSLGVHSTA